jgi:hypothetical protein
MPLYLVVHTPRPNEEAAVHAPSKLAALAREHGRADSRPRWIRTWSPDLHDERIFSMWEATSAEDINRAMQRYSFLSEMDAHPVCVQEWGPEDVLAEDAGSQEG